MYVSKHKYQRTVADFYAPRKNPPCFMLTNMDKLIFKYARSLGTYFSVKFDGVLYPYVIHVILKCTQLSLDLQ